MGRLEGTQLFLALFVLILCREVASYSLTLLHTNDVHSHFEQFNVYGGRCPTKSAEEGKCFGGFARLRTKEKEIRASHPNVVFLDGGDLFQGTVWYTLYKWKVVAEFVNQLGMDAMSLGNHEFDDGMSGLIPYLKVLNSTMVVCNINATEEPVFESLVEKSVVLVINGEKLGIIGYLTPLTTELSSPSKKLVFLDEVECVTKEALRLTRLGINKIIAVGHSGYSVDLKVAAIPEIDVVVGGHTNTFLYTGDPPSTEEAQGPYPSVVDHDDGTKALVVQDYTFGKYLGFLQIEFDQLGNAISWSGNPILLDNSVQQDEEVLKLVEPYAEEIKRRSGENIGRTNVLLRGDRCRMAECNLGNYMTDAAVDYFISDPTDKGWTDVAIAVWNSGSIRGSIDERINEGSITLEDVLTVSPFSNTMVIVALKGKHLREVLEASVRKYDADGGDFPGEFLQVSGLKVTYDVSLQPGSRVVEAKARCANCRVPRYQPIEDEDVYQVIMGDYMAEGGDGFSMIQKNAIRIKNTEELDIDILTTYMKKCSPATTGIEGRITMLGTETLDSEKIKRSLHTTKNNEHATEETVRPSDRRRRRSHSIAEVIKQAEDLIPF